ncbi:MAG: alpha/beta fold hydrolase [Solirubrobacteraceae bacterium]|nr:alpha/beta fold hydrolase [Solirubrobacteraceae bacterium]
MTRRFLVLAPVLAALAAPPPVSAARPDWRACGDGFQCATLPVPRDWARPGGARIGLSLIRLPASRPGPGRTRSLLVNFGGPGASGVTSLRQAGPLLRAATRGRMHVVSWDPRGVGESAPIRCPEGNDAFYDADPAAPEGLAAMAAAVRERAAACVARHGRWLGLIGTDQTVRDLDAIRAAVGDRRATFLGLSYGTRVGSVYAQTFPRRVRAMVLDGNMPPVSTVTSVSIGLASAFEGGLDEYVRRCARAADCPLGPDPAAGWDEIAARLRADPPVVPGTGGRRLTIGLFNQVTLALIINYQGSSGAAGAAIAEYRRTGDPTALYELGSAIAGGRRPDGSYATNGTETFQFINCLDWQDRPTPAQVAATAGSVRGVAPRLGAFGVAFAMMGSTACPVPPRPVPPISSDAIPPVLLVGNANDAETPLANSQEMGQALRGSRLLVWRGMGHTAITTSPCVARIAGRYLLTRALPPVGATCPDRPLD